MKFGDRFQVTARLSRPAYAYLIAFRPDNEMDVCYPENEDTPPPLTDTPKYPLNNGLKAYGIREGTGLWVLALLASDEPLPSYREWCETTKMTWRAPDQSINRRDLSKPGLSFGDECEPTSIVWCDGNVTEYLSRSGHRVHRGKDEELVGQAAIVPKVVELLKNRGVTAAAVGFLVEK